MCKKTFTERRRILNKIPEGRYCYNSTEWRGGIGPFKTCYYWKSIGRDRAKCKLLRVRDRYPQDTTLLWDQVKLCKYNRT